VLRVCFVSSIYRGFIFVFSGITIVLQWCYSGVIADTPEACKGMVPSVVTVLSQCCYSVVTVLLQCCYSVVTVLLQSVALQLTHPKLARAYFLNCVTKAL
jgi:hypothetical protein